ncbi:HNH endonuclease [Hymenobacter sp. HSC-4F20]|nr:HNH endonuclease [Hymenobacter sp. HSC-4F20]
MEHVIPESLGNKEHVLAKGLVCDKCNQYFAIKVEKPLLEQPYFRFVRNRLGIENKKQTIPVVEIISLSPGPKKVELMNDGDGQFSIIIPDGKSPSEYFGATSGRLIIPVLDGPASDNIVISRFLAKASIEALMLKVYPDADLMNEVLNKPDLEPIKQYARFGKITAYWPYHQRRLYSETSRFNNAKLGVANYEILHEWRFLYTDELHLYFVLCILGIEYAINMGGPGTESYKKWLNEHNHKSILDDSDEIPVS